MQLVDEKDQLALGRLDLGEHGFQPLLELAPVLRAGEQRADVERPDALALQRLGHVAGDDPLGEALDDRRLADPGIADQHRIVLGPAREHLDHAADLLVAADHWVELAGAGVGGQVAAELVQRLDGVLGVRRGDPMRAADLAGRFDQRIAVGKQVGKAGGLVGEREEDVLDRDVLVAERGHLLLSSLEDADERLGVAGLGLVLA
jgi:hypothetical protein